MGDWKHIFGECKTCGARMLVIAFPLRGTPIERFTKRLKALQCPYCDSGPDGIYLCPTEGEGAVTEPRLPTKAVEEGAGES